MERPKNMNNEKELITTILSQFPKAKEHKNKFFESDAEIIAMGSRRIAITADEFSAEDLFRDEDPYQLGWNVAAGTISDILASGAEPEFYAHSIVAKKYHWNQNYLKLMASGIGDLLKLSKSAFIGGDFGTSSHWHYTGICFGKVKKKLTRKGARAGDLIYLTGEVGAGNLEAALMLYADHKLLKNMVKNHKTYFKPRLKEAKQIRKYASSCIDTSDGLLNALNTIAEVNNVGYRINNLPYLKEGVRACGLISKPTELLLMGECGEYELMFTLKEKDEQEFLNKVTKGKLSVTRIGEIVNKGQKVMHQKGRQILLNDFNLLGRDYDDVKEYLKDLTKYIKKRM
jgi:thiamine-monophosphate kinase